MVAPPNDVSTNHGSHATGMLLPLGLALVFGLIGAGAATTYTSMTIPVNYTAAAWLRIAGQEPPTTFKGDGDGAPLNDKQATAILFKSRFVLDAAVRNPDVSELECIRHAEDPLAWIKERVEVGFLGDSEVLQVAMTGDNPEELATLVNAVVDAYMQEVVAVDRENHLRRKRLLETSYHHNQEQTRKKTQAFRELAATMDCSGDPELMKLRLGAQARVVADAQSRVGEIGISLRHSERELELYRTLLANAEKRGKADDGPDGQFRRQLEAALAADPAIARATAQVASLKTLIAEERLKLRDAQDDPPSVVKYREQIKDLEREIETRTKEMVPQLAQELRARGVENVASETTQELERLRARCVQLAVEEEVLKTELVAARQFLKEVSAEARELEKGIVELREQRRGLDSLKSITDRMGSELERWEGELAAGPRVSLLEPATVPEANDAARKSRMVVAAGIATFLLAFMAGGLLGFLLRRAR